MISLDEALAIVRSHRVDLGDGAVLLTSALGRNLAADIIAPRPAPSFESSAMDGYSVAEPLTGPWTVVGTVAAGSTWPNTLQTGEAVRIFTGAAVPKGAIAVIPQEDATLTPLSRAPQAKDVIPTEEGSNQYLIRTETAASSPFDGMTLSANQIKQGDHIRFIGEEYQAGTTLLTAGTRITPPILGVLASLGLPAVQVKTKPRVGLLCTGSEFLDPGTDWSEGKIYESNSHVLKTLLEGYGCEVQAESVIDDPDQLRDKCQALLATCDLLITVGGVSVGAFDFVEDAMCGLGFSTVFNKVSMKPGRPLTFALREDGKRWFGLPGNPMSATVTCTLAAGTFLGQEPEFFEATLDRDIERKPGREEFIPAQIDFQGGANVRPFPTVGSHATNGLRDADGLIRLPPDGSHFSKGNEVSFMFLPWRLSR